MKTLKLQQLNRVDCCLWCVIELMHMLNILSNIYLKSIISICSDKLTELCMYKPYAGIFF